MFYFPLSVLLILLTISIVILFLRANVGQSGRNGRLVPSLAGLESSEERDSVQHPEDVFAKGAAVRRETASTLLAAKHDLLNQRFV